MVCWVGFEGCDIVHYSYEGDDPGRVGCSLILRLFEPSETISYWCGIFASIN